jgi:integrase
MADFHGEDESPFSEGGVFGEASVKGGKSGVVVSSAGVSPVCPQCGSRKVWRDGLRYSVFGDKIQRWLCRDCGIRFSDPDDVEKSWSAFERLERVDTKSLKADAGIVSDRQICVTKAEGTKNLVAEFQKVETSRGQSEIDIKGKLLEYEFWMEKQGYDPETRRGWLSCLKALLSENANILDIESVKETLAKDADKKTPRWGGNRRRNIINAYTLFLRINKMHVWDKWERPKCTITKKFPFIPMEQEIDELIAGSGKKNASFAQLQKETAMRPGEAKILKWINIDSERNVITLNEPEKGSNPRMWKVSSRLIGMLNTLPKTSEQVFPGSLKSMKVTWIKTRKRLAQNLQNPRLKKITLYTLRHWKATMEYHRTKDIVYVQQLLGHKDIRNTMIYINIEHALFGASDNDEFTVRVATDVKGACALTGAGFEYVTGEYNDGGKIFKKRK